MASTYTSNLNIEKPAQGDQVNSWGPTVNDNMDLIDTAVAANLPKAGGTMTGNIVMSGSETVDGVDISARDAVLTSTTTTANAALPKAGGTITGNLVVNDDLTVDTDTLKVISGTDNVELNGYLTVNGTGVDINTTV